jgi:Tol biopolymer transport system component
MTQLLTRWGAKSAFRAPFTIAVALSISWAAAAAAAQAVPGHLKIVFSSTRDYSCPPDPVCDVASNNAELYIMNRNGSDQTRITDDNVLEFGAAWSPDGTKIAYYSPVSGQPQIFLMNPDGTGQMQLTNFHNGAQFPHWSPDGTQIVLQTHTPVTAREIYVIPANVDGTGLLTETNGTNLTNNPADDARPAWSRDGSRIAFMSNRDGNYEIYVMNADGSDPLRLTCDSADDRAPEWSPDSSHIVFQSDRPGHREIYVLDAANTTCGGEIGLTRLTNTDCSTCTTGEPRNQNPFWSPDGSQIAFESDRVNPELQILQVWVMNADGTNQKALTSLPGENGQPGWGLEADDSLSPSAQNTHAVLTGGAL